MFSFLTNIKEYIFGIGAAIVAMYIGYLKFKSASLEDDLETLNNKVQKSNTKAVLKEKETNIASKTLQIDESEAIKKELKKKEEKLSKVSQKIDKSIEKVKTLKKGKRVEQVFTI